MVWFSFVRINARLTHRFSFIFEMSLINGLLLFSSNRLLGQNFVGAYPIARKIFRLLQMGKSAKRTCLCLLRQLFPSYYVYLAGKATIALMWWIAVKEYWSFSLTSQLVGWVGAPAGRFWLTRKYALCPLNLWSPLLQKLKPIIQLSKYLKKID